MSSSDSLPVERDRHIPADAIDIPSRTRDIEAARLGYRFLKRSFDIVFSAAVVVVGLVPGAVLAIAVARDTGGSPIYSQERIGRHGKPFRLYKFRSMVADSDNVEKYLDEDQLKI